METQGRIEQQIREAYPSLSKGQKKLADYLLQNSDQASFWSATRLGEAAGVSEASVIRFAARLGYSGYTAFQRRLGEELCLKLHSEKPSDEHWEQLETEELVRQVLQTDAKQILDTIPGLDGQAFTMALYLLNQAKRIYIIGLRGSAPLARFFYSYLHLIFPDVILLNSTNENELLEQMIHISRDDVIFAFGFPRYSLQTVRALEFANSRNAGVITLTNTVHSPISLYSSCNLVARSGLSSIIESLAAPMSVVNALLLALCMEHKETVLHNMEEIEGVLDAYQVFGNDEMDYMETAVELRP